MRRGSEVGTHDADERVAGGKHADRVRLLEQRVGHIGRRGRREERPRALGHLGHRQRD